MKRKYFIAGVFALACLIPAFGLKAQINPLTGIETELNRLSASRDTADKKTLEKKLLTLEGSKLVDLNGKSVSLSSLKGKTVVLDFWATWCGPCKASFPAMQMAINKYKEDPSVQFLFIHTWERDEDAAKEALEYIRSANYNFRVLIDTKDPQSKVNTVADAYRINSIPAKFVIDPRGNIRFNASGAAGSKQGIVDELSMMIDMVKNAGNKI